MKFAIFKYGTSKAIDVEANSREHARHVAKDWIGGDLVHVAEVEDYVPPSRVTNRPPSLPGVPDEIAACLSRARAHNEETRRRLDGAYRVMDASVEAAGGRRR